MVNNNINHAFCKPTSVVVVVRVHECHSHGVLSMQSALVGVAAIHCVDHVSHFLPGGSNGVFTFFSQFPVGADDNKIRHFLTKYTFATASQQTTAV